jgi:hypothetical protein
MIQRFESEEDLRRERRAIELFVNTFGGSYKKLDPNDIDYKVFDKDNKLIAYVEVKGRIRTMREAYPLPISARKFIKLADKMLNPVIIWACEDGIIYVKANKLVGTVLWGGRASRANSYDDNEFMLYFEKQKCMKYIRFT